MDGNGGNLTQLTFGESNELDSTVSPDGNWIVYASTVVKDTSERSELWKIPAGGGEPARLGNIECYTPNYSPDGKFISCISDHWKKVRIISAGSGAAIETLTPIGEPILNIGAKWTPDSTVVAYIYLQANVNNIGVQQLNGGAARSLTNFTSGDIYNFAFSADGSHLFLARGYATRNAVLISNFR